MAGEYAAFFDLDDTILDTASGKVFLEYCFNEGMYSVGEIAEGVMVGLGYRFGIYSAEEVVRMWAMYYKGWPREKMADLSNTLFETEIKKHIRPAAVEEINRHKRNGAKIVMLSASTTFICEPVQKLLEIDDLLCTHLQVDEQDQLTGHLDGDYIYGRNKLVHGSKYCEKNNYKMAEAHYYGDSNADRFMLDAVGYAYAVNPGTRLKALAQTKGWSVVNW